MADQHIHMPGDFPETPYQETAEYPKFDPPAASKSAGAVSSDRPESREATPTHPTVGREDAPKRDDGGRGSDQAFRVNPLPATAGAGNPINLKPGEKVPEPGRFTTNTIRSAVTLDKESYDRAGAAFDGPPVLPPVVTPQQERDMRGIGVLDLPPITRNLIPESSLPMNDAPSSETDPGVTISSAAPDSSTAALAAKVPLEPRHDAPSSENDPGVTVSSAAPNSSTAALASKVPLEPRHDDAEVPAVVRKSQMQAHADPEASASPEAVYEKKEVEQELMQEVGAVPPTVEGEGLGRAGDPSRKAEQTTASQGALGQAPPPATPGRDAPMAGGPHSNEEGEPAKLGGSAVGHTRLPSSVLQSIEQINSDVDAQRDPPTAAGVPDVVAQSLDRAHWSPEAAGNAEAVAEKKAVEHELLEEVKPAERAGQPAPTESAALSEFAPAPMDQGRPAPPAPAREEPSVPAPRSPAAAPVADARLPAVDKGLPLPPAVKPQSQPQDSALPLQSSTPMPATSDVPKTETFQTQPVPAPAPAPATVSMATPQKAAAQPSSSTTTPQRSSIGESAGSGSGKKDKRRSGFFGKLKEKLRQK